MQLLHLTSLALLLHTAPAAQPAPAATARIQRATTSTPPLFYYRRTRPRPRPISQMC